MLQTQTDNLPLEQLQMVDSDFLADEQAYLAMRDTLMSRFLGQWVAIRHGKVIAAERNLMKVMESAATSGGHPYIALVGGEDATVFRVRRSIFGYDQAYQPFPLPRAASGDFVNRLDQECGC